MASPAEEETRPSDEPLSTTERKVYEWRRDEFARLGFAPFSAELLASDQKVDLASARHLVQDKHCPVDLALQILS